MFSGITIMYSKQKRLIVILGPTAAGKTALSLRLAQRFKGEIVSADSRQVYKGMDIGTGKVTKKEMQGIPHYLLDIASPKRHFSASQYQKLAIKAINQIIQKGKTPFLVGGSPFYIYAVTEGWKFPKIKPNWKLRKSLEQKTPKELLKILKKLDPRRAQNIEPENKRRLARAIEIAKNLGRVPKLRKEQKFTCLFLGVLKSKNELAKLIQIRLLKRFKQGMIAEVKRLKDNGVSWKKLESFGLEYRWIARYLQGKVTKMKMQAKLENDIRKFAKRQMTWFKKDQKIKWVASYQEAEKLVKNFLENKKGELIHSP